MKLIDKVYNKLGYILLDSKWPVFILIGLLLVSKNHLYIDRNFIQFRNIFASIKGFEKVLLTGTGVLIVFFKDTIVKYPLGKHSLSTLEKEYKNFLLLKASSLSKLVDYFLEKKEHCLVVERLYESSYSSYEYMTLYKTLSSVRYDEVEVRTLLEHQPFVDAFSYINTVCKKVDIHKVQAFFKSKKMIASCAMHGDLTLYNMMKNKKNKIVLIDLDRFRFDGLTKIDRIHFVLEYYAKKRGEDFFDLIIRTVKGKGISNEYTYMLFFYLIYRIGIEYNKDIHLPYPYTHKMCQVIKIFVTLSRI